MATNELLLPKPKRRGRKPRRRIRSNWKNKGKRTSRRRKERKVTRNQCHTIWSLAVRARDKTCQAIGETLGRQVHTCDSSVLQGAHGLGKKAYPAVRFKTWNGYALCPVAHVYYTWREPEWQNFLRKRWGNELYEQRLRDACQLAKYNLAEVRDALLNELAILRKETR